MLDWEAARFHRATALLGLEAAVSCELHCADRSIESEIPLERDDGTLEVYTGYRVQHSRALGPRWGRLAFKSVWFVLAGLACSKRGYSCGCWWPEAISWWMWMPGRPSGGPGLCHPGDRLASVGMGAMGRIELSSTIGEGSELFAGLC